jgi:2-dehydropantoate 2-reductase
LRVAVIGAGAIGGPIAAHIAENKIDITIVTKHPKLADLIQTKGIKLQGFEKNRYVSIKAIPSIHHLKGKFDIVFLAMKAMDVVESSKALLPFLHDDSVVVTLQNGIVEDDVATLVGRNRVIGAVVVWTSKMIEPGIIEITSPNGVFFIGLLDGEGNQKRLNEVSGLLKLCFPVVVTENIYGALYSKLSINAAMNGLGAISGYTVGKIVEYENTRHILMGIITESLNLANTLDIQPISLGGTVQPQDIALTESDSFDTLAKKHQTLIEVFSPHGEAKSSTLQSLERGQPSEINYLNGYISKKGEELGIQTPINTVITHIVKEIEAGKRKISPDNLLELPIP